MYYPAGTLKARMCVEGRHFLYEICRRNKIPHKKTGKLIIATDKEEIISLDNLLVQGRDNGVDGLRMMTKEEISKIEPGAAGISALYSEETGILDSHNLMKYFLSEAKDKGAIFVFGAEVIAIDKTSGGGYRLRINNQNEDVTLEAGAVINCAGLDSDKIARIAGFH